MNDELKTLFNDYRPAMGDGDEYMERLEEKMLLLETVKRQGDEVRRRYRRGMVVAFATGTVLGAASMVFMLLHPLPVPRADATRLALLLQKSYPALIALAVAGLSALAAHLATMELRVKS